MTSFKNQKSKIKNKKHIQKNTKIFRFLVCVFYLWFFIFGFSGARAFQFVVFGDNRDGDQTFLGLMEKVNQEKEIAFAVNTGDFVAGGKKWEYQKYKKMISRLKTPIYHVLGNHDAVWGGWRIFQEFFGAPYYSFDYDNSHFVILDNSLPGAFDRKQFSWFKKDLEKNKKENTFVFLHRPMFDPTEIYEGHVMGERKIAEELMRVFVKYKVDYVIAGHIHGYARTTRDGVTYIITGGAGAPLYLPKDFGGFYHYVKIRVEGEKIQDQVVKL